MKMCVKVHVDRDIIILLLLLLLECVKVLIKSNMCVHRVQRTQMNVQKKTRNYQRSFTKENTNERGKNSRTTNNI